MATDPDDILESTRIYKGSVVDPGFVGVHFLAPYGRRISFHSQQARAFNLVWALKQKDLLRSPIAVIGAGVAGVTVACALGALGQRVVVFEEATTPIWRQGSTKHRVLHPHINQWPRATQPASSLLPVTDFPFLNWYYSTCDVAVSTIREDLELFRLSPEVKITIERGTCITGIDRDDKDKKITLRAETKLYPGFELVVVCSGFQPERTAAKVQVPCREYWCADDLERNRAHGRINHYVVNGVGDGGLIDVLRLAFERFDYGRLTLAVAELMTTTAQPLVARIAAEEALIQQGTPTQAYAEIASEVADGPDYPQLTAFLDKALGDRKLDIFAIDNKITKIFGSVSAAPIHKFLAAYALQRGHIQFENKDVDYSPLDKNKNKKKNKTLGIKTLNLNVAETEVVFRLGADPNFGKLLDANSAKDLGGRQKVANNFYSALVDPPAIQAMFTNLPKAHVPNAPEFFALRRDLVERAWRELDPGASVYLEDDKIHLVARDVSAVVPDTLFGVPIVTDAAASPPTIAPAP